LVFYGGHCLNQIKRDVCCLDIENGGMSMVNLDSYIDSRRITFIYCIINEPVENWNAVEKYWLILHNYSFTFVQKFSAFPNLYTIFHSINNVLPNFIIVNIVTMMYPQSFYILNRVGWN
jgi:DNA integrity scanning protein DisA with diadenylate cyclase activity